MSPRRSSSSAPCSTTSPIPGETQTAVLQEIIPIFIAENQLQPGADAEKALAELFAPQFIQSPIVDASATTDKLTFFRNLPGLRARRSGI